MRISGDGRAGRPRSDTATEGQGEKGRQRQTELRERKSETYAQKKGESHTNTKRVRCEM